MRNRNGQIILFRVRRKNGLHKIIREMHHDSWTPDYIVGLTRGGLPLAVMLSHYLDKPMHALNASFRDNLTGPESNAWMAEDAFGYDKIRKKDILIIDDINDSGHTLNWIIDDWQRRESPMGGLSMRKLVESLTK